MACFTPPLPLESTIIHDFMLYTTITYSCVEFRCAVQSSALCDGVAALLICSTGTVAAHSSIGVSEQRHRQPSAVRPSFDRRDRGQDNVSSVVPDLPRPHPPERISFVSDGVRQTAGAMRLNCARAVHRYAPRSLRALPCARYEVWVGVAAASPA